MSSLFWDFIYNEPEIDSHIRIFASMASVASQNLCECSKRLTSQMTVSVLISSNYVLKDL